MTGASRGLAAGASGVNAREGKHVITDEYPEAKAVDQAGE